MLIDKLEYIKVIRKMDRLEQKIIEENREMHLYESSLETKFHTFMEEQVLDLTYQTMSNGRSTLFIHTDHGVYTYLTLDDPGTFIERAKETLQITPY